MNIYELYKPVKRTRFQQIVLQGSKPAPNELIVVDATLSSSYSSELDISSHPIEDGSTVQDHAQKKAKVYTMTGYISEEPLSLDLSLIGLGSGLVGSMIGGTAGRIATGVFAKIGSEYLNDLTGLGSVVGEKRINSALQILKNMQEKKIPIQIMTKKDVLDNMLLKSLRIPDDVSKGRGLEFEATFEEIRIVSTQTFTVNKMKSDVQHSMQKNQALGNKNKITASTDDNTKMKSWASGIFGKGGFLRGL